MEFTAKNFDKEVLKSAIPVLVDFWASWCPPCKVVEPILEELAQEYLGKVKIGKLNVDRNPGLGAKYDITGVPTFIIFKDGRIKDRAMAAKSKSELKNLIEKFL
ncbi:MAG: thioredoxin [Promethearchaeota archaeon]